MISLHWSMLAFAGLIVATIFYILGCLDVAPVEKDEAYYTEEEDAYWAEFVRVLNKRDGRQ